VIGATGKVTEPGTLAGLPRHCEGHRRPPCYTLTVGSPDEKGEWHSCEPGSEPCAKPHKRTGPGPYSGTAYYRVLRKGRPQPDKSPSPFAKADEYFNPGQERPTTLIQYWLFYPYDEWSRPVLAGKLTQRHEGDWEAVTVGLSDEKPIFVAYSAHCGSSELSWDQAPVAVAEGSHANYPRQEDTRPPDWLACAKGPAGVTKLISYAANIRDETGNAWTVNLDDLLPADARYQPMRFPGSWGLNDLTTLTNRRTQPIGHPGSGPLAPRLQALWLNPLQKIFCSKNSYPRTCD
jgi:hypothetical protein